MASLSSYGTSVRLLVMLPSVGRGGDVSITMNLRFYRYGIQIQKWLPGIGGRSLPMITVAIHCAPVRTITSEFEKWLPGIGGRITITFDFTVTEFKFNKWLPGIGGRITITFDFTVTEFKFKNGCAVRNLITSASTCGDAVCSRYWLPAHQPTISVLPLASAVRTCALLS